MMSLEERVPAPHVIGKPHCTATSSRPEIYHVRSQRRCYLLRVSKVNRLDSRLWLRTHDYFLLE